MTENETKLEKKNEKFSSSRGGHDRESLRATAITIIAEVAKGLTLKTHLFYIQQ